uniref:C2H2-type domain-containing protein n=1 Tax=Biomphalaria glabrata TaxID=6526 RepID=A0A2C9KBS4_BIOGL
MDWRTSFSHLVAEFKTQLQSISIPLKGQLIFFIGETPEVHVMFLPLPSSSVAYSNKQESDFMKRMNTTSEIPSFSSYGMNEFNLLIPTNSRPDIDDQNGSSQLASKYAVNHIVLMLQANAAPYEQNEEIAVNKSQGLCEESELLSDLSSSLSINKTQDFFSNEQDSCQKFELFGASHEPDGIESQSNFSNANDSLADSFLNKTITHVNSIDIAQCNQVVAEVGVDKECQSCPESNEIRVVELGRTDQPEMIVDKELKSDECFAVVKKLNLSVSDLHKFSHSELVSILTEILQSNVEENKSTADKDGETAKEFKAPSDLQKALTSLEMKTGVIEKKITENNSIPHSPNKYTNSRNRRHELIHAESDLHSDETIINKSLDKQERNSSKPKKKGKLDNKRHPKLVINKSNHSQLSVPANDTTVKEMNCQIGKQNLTDIDHPLKNQKNGSGRKESTSQKLVFQCTLCTTTYSNRGLYENHLRQHSCGFQCDECGKTLKSKDSLYHHKRGLHALKKQYCCHQCNASFNFYHSCKLHVLRHQGQRPFSCQVCHKTYLTSNHLKVHVEATHKVGKKVCHVCGKTFAYSCSLKTHLLKHTGHKLHTCDQCGKSFTSNQSLKAHCLSHENIKKYHCDVCGKAYQLEQSRNVHMKQHGKEKRQFICELCGKTFHFKSTLTAHINIHSKARPYLCSQCGKGFKSKASLYTHKLIHKEGQSFACPTCNKTFRTKNCCNAHMARHKKQLTFTCTMCESTFPDKGGLSKHISTIHEPSKNFICKICGKRSTRGDNMRAHVKNHKKDFKEPIINPKDFIIEENLTETEVGLNNFKPRIRGPKQPGSKKVYIKDILRSRAKNEPQNTNINLLDFSNQSNSGRHPIATLQPDLLTIPVMDSSHYITQLSFLNDASFLHTNTHNSDPSLVQTESHEEGDLFQQEVDKTSFYFSLMQQPSSDNSVSDHLSYGPITNLLSDVHDNEPDPSAISNSLLSTGCHDDLDLPQHSSPGQMHSLSVSCFYSDTDEGNMSQLHDLLNHDNAVNSSDLI